MNATTSLLPNEFNEPDENGFRRPIPWGIFGYRGAMCDRAIRSDNAPMLAECLEREFFGPDDEMLTFKTVRQYCKEKAPACYEMLQERAPQTVTA